MKRETLGIAALWLVIIAVVGLASWYGIHETVNAVLKIAVAIIGAAAILLGAILTHALTTLREQHLEQRRHMQENYKNLVERIAPYVRDPKNSDDFETIHLHSWVVGSPRVVSCTQTFMAERSPDALRQLLAAMRSDLGLREAPKGVSLENILKQPEPKSGLNPNKTA
jgi:hypothetical protein